METIEASDVDAADQEEEGVEAEAEVGAIVLCGPRKLVRSMLCPD